jgi:hypothetical protein
MKTLFTVCLILLQAAISIPQTRNSIYHSGWIDFNKNGREDIYEDSSAPLEKRIDDLLAQMTLEEKTNQLATLYGFGRVLKDELPTPEWKIKIWKDGIANIDEHLNGLAYHPEAKRSIHIHTQSTPKPSTRCSVGSSRKHVWAFLWTSRTRACMVCVTIVRRRFPAR